MPVCITGMHRSGTSMVSRLLNLCGLYLGQQEYMIRPSPDNPAGFWEHVWFFQFNEKILEILGGGWDFLPPKLTEAWESDPIFLNMQKMVIEYIHDFYENEPWGWKDPRNSLTLPFWKKLFPDLRIIVCLRNPLEVAQSLKKRNDHCIAFGLHLWLKYNISLLNTAPYQSRLITNYDSYFQNPQKELKRMLSWLGIKYSDETVEKACETISISLKHNNISINQMMSSNVHYQVIKLYKAMCKEADKIIETE